VMARRSVLLRGGVGQRVLLVFVLAAQPACLPEIKERCPLIVGSTQAPALPHDLAQLDALLVRRATDLVEASRGLHRFQVWWFRVGFAEQILPDLCGRLERARELAMAGRTVEAGKKYQAVLVASQVVNFAIAMHAVAQQAEVAGQSGGQITQTIARFADQAKPIYDAALSEDPQRIAGAIHEHPEVFKEWADCLEQWPARINDGVERVRVAKVVWDITFLVAATYQAAGAAAEMAVAGRPPMPLVPAAFALGGGATAVGFSEVASIELVETIRRLIASGVLDAGVVAAISHTLGGGPSSGTPSFSDSFQMSSAPQPPGGTNASNAPAAERARTAYELAKSGGKHAGTLRNYAGRPIVEIEKAISSYERQVAIHQQKIANPAQFVERWGEMSSQEQAGLLNKWGADAARNQELADVLRGLLEAR